MDKDKYILTYLSKELQCDFLSDLHSRIYHIKEKQYFEGAPMYRFPLEDWQYVYQYILGIPSTATTLEEMRAEFLRNL